mmetsp:Transcript_3478/g.5332  ORF Transcript_3478/g.5332 Transcript_3478/m.5332 type:complete len:620 (-) Transcript_3478:202-2061(-)
MNSERLDKVDFSQETWISLLDLLGPSDFLITVDNLPIWRRHLSWAKTDGAELRNYTTQRFSSSMVFCSLLLGANISTLFNSAHLTTTMRENLGAQNYQELSYWIGAMIIWSVMVTLSALITTFTAWGMVSAVSDENAHCVLRSSIGQFVTYMPSRLIVTALYSSLAWVVMFMIDIVSGPLRYVLLCAIGLLFFQAVIVYSAFGRLIIHTGAMGKKQIFDPELECELLPSGLHAGLVIKANEKRKRQMSVVHQYKPKLEKKGSSNTLFPTDCSEDDSSTGAEGTEDPHQQTMHSRQCMHGQQRGINSGLERLDSFYSNDEVFQLITHTANQIAPTSSDDDISTDDIENQSGETELGQLGSKESIIKNNGASLSEYEGGTIENVTHGTRRSNANESIDSISKGAMFTPATSKSKREIFSKRKSKRLSLEWKAENDCRSMYDISSPSLPPPLQETEEVDLNASIILPRAEFLNKTRRLKSLRNLAKETVANASPTVSEKSTISSASFATGTNTNDMNLLRRSPSAVDNSGRKKYFSGRRSPPSSNSMQYHLPPKIPDLSKHKSKSADSFPGASSNSGTATPEEDEFLDASMTFEDICERAPRHETSHLLSKETNKLYSVQQK